MNCDRVRALIDAYTTDELDLAAALDVQEHLHACPACAADLESLHSLRRTVQSASLRYSAPPELHRRILAHPDPIDARENIAPRHRIRTFALAAAIAALLLLPWLAMYRNASRFTSEQLAAEITSSHIRSLMADHLLDVPSTDQHTVKPWFNGKLDFSPAVVDLTTEGFPLIGGRLDYINNRPVAAIVYQRHKHLINLYTWPTTAADTHLSLLQHNGYNLVTWTHNRMNCVAVSDVNQQELRQFSDLLQSNGTTRP